MEDLVEVSTSLISKTSLDFERYLAQDISWQNRLIGIKGARGVGKTTLLLQYLKKSPFSFKEKLYVSLDDLYFTTNSLVDLAKIFYLQGGKLLVLDEVHKYSLWARAIKNIYDRYEGLQIIFTGSSILDITKREGDMSRRALIYSLNGLSYREYLHLKQHLSLPKINLEALLQPNFHIYDVFPKDFNPYVYFRDYLVSGYYPFSSTPQEDYSLRLKQIIRTIVEYDMAEIQGYDTRQAKKLLQLLYIIAQQVPFKPNLSSLAQKTQIHRNSLSNYLVYLSEAKLIALLYPKNYSISSLQKPEKIYLENTNFMYALNEAKENIGTIRETFFYNQVRNKHDISLSSKVDFLVEGRYHFEIGGKQKPYHQIKNLEKAWLVKDDIIHPQAQTLPLWVFGFLY